jgi:hypothetical protein
LNYCHFSFAQESDLISKNIIDILEKNDLENVKYTGRIKSYHQALKREGYFVSGKTVKITELDFNYIDDKKRKNKGNPDFSIEIWHSDDNTINHLDSLIISTSSEIINFDKPPKIFLRSNTTIIIISILELDYYNDLLTIESLLKKKLNYSNLKTKHKKIEKIEIDID